MILPDGVSRFSDNKACLIDQLIKTSSVLQFYNTHNLNSKMGLIKNIVESRKYSIKE